MASTNEVINLDKSTNTPPKPKLTDAQKAELKAKVTRVLERGMLGDRLNVDLPSELYGEWIFNNPVEIDRMKTMGYEIDTQYAVNNALHSDGTGKPIVGDVIFMVAPKEVKELYDEANRELFNRTHGKYKKKEETEFSQLIERQGTPVHNNSTSRLVDGNTIKQTIEGK